MKLVLALESGDAHYNVFANRESGRGGIRPGGDDGEHLMHL